MRIFISVLVLLAFSLTIETELTNCDCRARLSWSDRSFSDCIGMLKAFEVRSGGFIDLCISNKLGKCLYLTLCICIRCHTSFGILMLSEQISEFFREVISACFMLPLVAGGWWLGNFQQASLKSRDPDESCQQPRHWHCCHPATPHPFPAMATLG